MNVGILRLYVGASGKIGQYNVQEIGLARELIKQDSKIKVYIFFLSTEVDNVRIDDIQENIYLVYLPCKKLSVHGIFKLELLERFELNNLHILSDTQMFSGRVIKWCLKNSIKPICVFGTISTTNKNKALKAAINTVFSYNKRYFNKAINVAKNPSVYEDLKANNIKNVHLIPVGLDKTLLNADEIVDKDSLRDKLGLPLEKRILLFVGRLSDYKKPLFALEVFKKLVQADPRYSMVIIGDGELKDNVLGFIDSNGLADSIKYIDKINNDLIWQYYEACDLFVNTNDKEIFGMSILESMYYRCPVIAVDAPGPRYILNGGENGYLLEGYDVEEWISKIETIDLYDTDFIKKAKDAVNNKFCWDKIVNRYIELYK